MHLLDAYLKYKEAHWAPSTSHTTSKTLRSWVTHTVSPEALWAEMDVRGTSAYTRVTVWMRVEPFYEWCMQQRQMVGPNPFTVFRHEHPREFARAKTYKRKHCPFDFSEVVLRVQSLPDAEARGLALDLLYNGMRYHEAATRESDGTITGKGGHRRTALLDAGVGEAPFTGSYSTFLRRLKAVGLTPHMLRKAAATHYGKQLDDIDLMQVFGWSTIETSKYYRRPSRDAEIRAKLKEMSQCQANTSVGFKKL